MPPLQTAPPDVLTSIMDGADALLVALSIADLPLAVDRQGPARRLVGAAGPTCPRGARVVGLRDPLRGAAARAGRSLSIGPAFR